MSGLVWVWSAATEPGTYLSKGDVAAIVLSPRRLCILSAKPAWTRHGRAVHDAIVGAVETGAAAI
jgi:hypothetical protein